MELGETISDDELILMIKEANGLKKYHINSIDREGGTGVVTKE